MKRFFLSILTVLVPVCLFATYTLGFGNDTFSYGFSDDRDDGCTHAVLMKYEGSIDGVTDYEFNAHLMSYTVRPMTYMDIRGETQYYAGRIDELRLNGGMSRDIVVDESTINMGFLLGCSFYGNFGGELLQNLCHSTLGVKAVCLDYEYLPPKATLLSTIKIESGGRAHVGIFAWGGYEGLLKMGGKFYVGYGDDKSVFNSFVGVEANMNVDNRVLSYTSLMSMGVMSGFSLDTGFLYLDYKRYHDRNNGYGTVSFSIGNEDTWEENDIYLSYGAYPIYGRPMNTLVVRKPIGDNIQVVVKDDFFSEVYQVAPIKGLSTLTSIELGVRGGDTWYAQTSIGYGWTRCEDHSVDYNVEHPIVQKEGYITGSLEFGYSWMSDITVGSSNLGIEMFCGIHSKGNTNLLKNHGEFSHLEVTDTAPYFGARAIVGIDI